MRCRTANRFEREGSADAPACQAGRETLALGTRIPFVFILFLIVLVVVVLLVIVFEVFFVVLVLVILIVFEVLFVVLEVFVVVLVVVVILIGVLKIVNVLVILVLIVVEVIGRRRRGDCRRCLASRSLGATAACAPGLCDGDAPILPLAGAAGDDVPVIGEGHVDDASVCGRHRIEGDGSPPPPDVLGGAESYLLQTIDVALLIALNVYAQGDKVSEAPGDDRREEHLDVTERLSAPANQEAGVFPLNLKQDGLSGLGGSRRITARNVHRDLRLHAHQGQEFSQDVAGAVRVLRQRGKGEVVRFIVVIVVARSEADASFFSAEAQEAGTSFAKNVYVDVVEVEAQFFETVLNRLLDCPPRRFQALLHRSTSSQRLVRVNLATIGST